jgi:hypothetical protein
VKLDGVLAEERRREDLVRGLPCPTCLARPGEICHSGDGKKMFMSHSRRYSFAADEQLVPRLPWMN